MPLPLNSRLRGNERRLHRHDRITRLRLALVAAFHVFEGLDDVELGALAGGKIHRLVDMAAAHGGLTGRGREGQSFGRRHALLGIGAAGFGRECVRAIDAAVAISADQAELRRLVAELREISSLELFIGLARRVLKVGQAGEQIAATVGADAVERILFQEQGERPISLSRPKPAKVRLKLTLSARPA